MTTPDEVEAEESVEGGVLLVTSTSGGKSLPYSSSRSAGGGWREPVDPASHHLLPSSSSVSVQSLTERAGSDVPSNSASMYCRRSGSGLARKKGVGSGVRNTTAPSAAVQTHTACYCVTSSSWWGFLWVFPHHMAKALVNLLFCGLKLLAAETRQHLRVAANHQEVKTRGGPPAG